MRRSLLFPALALLGAALALGAAPPVPDARAFRDDFEGDTLAASWEVLHPDYVDLQVSDGALEITPNRSGFPWVWYESFEGVLVHRTVSGDFTAVTRAHARDATDPTQPPGISYRMGGILARSPASTIGACDNLHVTLGAGVPGTPVCAEVKVTNDSVTSFTLHPIASPDGYLRMRRRGAEFELAHRASGAGAWTVLATHTRADMPETLQVGLIAYSYSGPPDLVARFDHFVLGP